MYFILSKQDLWFQKTEDMQIIYQSLYFYVTSKKKN